MGWHSQGQNTHHGHLHSQTGVNKIHGNGHILLSVTETTNHVAQNANTSQTANHLKMNKSFLHYCLVVPRILCKMGDGGKKAYLVLSKINELNKDEWKVFVDLTLLPSFNSVSPTSSDMVIKFIEYHQLTQHWVTTNHWFLWLMNWNVSSLRQQTKYTQTEIH